MNLLIAVVLSSAVAGTLDILSAMFLAKQRGMTARTLLQFVASGALGEGAFQGGARTAGAGLFFHYLIAVIWAVVYFLVGIRALGHPFLYGALYGVVVHLVMSLMVVPLSRTRKRPFVWQGWVVQLAIHVFLVGIPIAVVQGWLRG